MLNCMNDGFVFIDLNVKLIFNVLREGNSCFVVFICWWFVVFFVRWNGWNWDEF